MEYNFDETKEFRLSFVSWMCRVPVPDKLCSGVPNRNSRDDFLIKHQTPKNTLVSSTLFVDFIGWQWLPQHMHNDEMNLLYTSIAHVSIALHSLAMKIHVYLEFKMCWRLLIISSVINW